MFGSTFSRDARYAVRIFATKPGFTVALSLTLVIGIGLNAAVFSVVNAMLLRPLPVTEPNELVRIYRVVPEDFLSHTFVGSADFAYLREHSRSLSDLSGNMYAPLVLEYREASRLIMGDLVTGNYFSFLGIKPFLGRTFTREEDTPETVSPVVVLSNFAWRRRFGADPNVVGEVLRINGHPFTVIGVAPENFFGLTRGISPEVWLPLEAVRFLRSSWNEKENPLTGSVYHDSGNRNSNGHGCSPTRCLDASHAPCAQAHCRRSQPGASWIYPDSSCTLIGALWDRSPGCFGHRGCGALSRHCGAYRHVSSGASRFEGESAGRSPLRVAHGPSRHRTRLPKESGP